MASPHTAGRGGRRGLAGPLHRRRAHAVRAQRFELFSPIDQRLLGHVAAGQPAHVEMAVAAATCLPRWSAMTAAERLPYLDRFAARDRSAGGRLLHPRKQRRGRAAVAHAAWGGAARHARTSAGSPSTRWACRSRPIDTEQAHHRVRHDPAGVVVVITPWNAPLMLSTWKLGPALAAGNTCILKPPEWAPLTCSLLADAAHAAGLPPAVFNVVQGVGATTRRAVGGRSPLARVSFTGSVPTGQRIAQACGANLVPCSLELGGKSPFIVLEDADIDAAAATGALMYRNAGQVCLAGTRFLVHERVAERFIAAMRTTVEGLCVGDPRDEAPRSAPSSTRARSSVCSASSSGRWRVARQVLWGGQPHPFGRAEYVQPTMVTGLTQDDEIVQNEVFGPVLTLQTFASDDEAVAMANGTDYGLGGVVLRRHGACHRHRRPGAHRLHLGQQLRHPRPPGPVRRHQAQRHRPRGRGLELRAFCDVKDVVVPKKPFSPSFSHR